MVRPIAPSEGLRRGGRGICCAEGDVRSSTGDSVKLSNRLGVDEHNIPFVATFPKRKGGNWVSVLVCLCGTKLIECALVRDSEGLVAGRFRLVETVSQYNCNKEDDDILRQLKERRRWGWRSLCNWLLLWRQ